MKIKTDFVTNSSSASFIIDVKKITTEQADKLMEWAYSENNEDGWGIHYTEGRDFIEGFTAMDNCDIIPIIEELKLIEVIEWERN